MHAPRSQKTILIIEDDISIREVLQESLESEGYKTLETGNGKEGIAQLRSAAKPSLILLDMMMPIMDGRAFLDFIRADHEFKEVPVIVVSANASPTQANGANAFIPKPIDFVYLLKKISELSR